MVENEGHYFFDLNHCSLGDFFVLSLAEVDVVDSFVEVALNVFFLRLLPVQHVFNYLLDVDHFPVVLFSQMLSNRLFATLLHAVNHQIHSLGQFGLCLQEFPRVLDELILRVFTIEQKHSPCIGTRELSLAIDNLTVFELHRVDLLPQGPPPDHFGLLDALSQQLLFGGWL